MTATKSMDTELMHLDFNFLDEEPPSSSSVLGDQMDCGTFGNLSDVSPKISKDSDLFLFNPPSLNTTTNREAISSMNPLCEQFDYPDPEFTSPYSDDFYSLILDKYISEDQDWLTCGNLMHSPLSSEDIDSILDTTSLSDDGDVSLLPFGTPPSSPESQDNPVSSPLPFISLIHSNESDGTQASGPILDADVGQATGVAVATATTGETLRGISPCLLVSSPGKEKRTKSYRTKKTTPYSRGKSTESISSTTDILAQPQQLSKKEKKKLQNKNAATRYRQKMKEEAEQQKHEEDDLLKENVRLKKKVEDIQKEIQYLKNLLEEIGKARTKSVKLEQN